VSAYAGHEVLPIAAAPWADLWHDIDGLRWAWRAWCGEAYVLGATNGSEEQAQRDARHAERCLLDDRWTWRQFSVARTAQDPLVPGLARCA
jgi:hypothetical protein